MFDQRRLEGEERGLTGFSFWGSFKISLYHYSTFYSLHTIEHDCCLMSIYLIKAYRKCIFNGP